MSVLKSIIIRHYYYSGRKQKIVSSTLVISKVFCEFISVGRRRDLLFEVPDEIILDDLAGGGDHVDQTGLSSSHY